VHKYSDIRYCSTICRITAVCLLRCDNNKKLITDYTISIDDPQKMALNAEKILENGFSIIKVKVGRDGNRDVERSG